MKNKFYKKMKKEKLEMKSKKRLLVLAGISTAVILGGTLAYFTTSDNFENVFTIAKYQPQVVEQFESPETWTPGTTTSKIINITNNGNINMAVRASYEEKWISSDGTHLSLQDSDGNIVSIINFNEGWKKNSDGYYYYGTKENLTKLKPNETSSSFISGVTFNETVKANLKKTVSSDGKTITYESTGSSYDGARYILTIKIDTIQYDQALNVW